MKKVLMIFLLIYFYSPLKSQQRIEIKEVEVINVVTKFDSILSAQGLRTYDEGCGVDDPFIAVKLEFLYPQNSIKEIIDFTIYFNYYFNGKLYHSLLELKEMNKQDSFLYLYLFNENLFEDAFYQKDKYDYLDDIQKIYKTFELSGVIYYITNENEIVSFEFKTKKINTIKFIWYPFYSEDTN